MSKTDAYRAVYDSALRENERLRNQIAALLCRVEDLEAERNRLKASRGAVLDALDLKGRLKAMLTRVKK
jgi:hypothetical protein